MSEEHIIQLVLLATNAVGFVLGFAAGFTACWLRERK
jgi:hypothetical protein